MSDRHETIADIIAWLRRPRDGENAYLTAWRDEIADRLEAAWRRECAKIEADALAVGGIVEAGRKRELSKNASKNGADFGQLGDAAKLREALEKCANWGEQIDCQLGSSDETVYAFRHERCLAHNISECARAALSAPPRNCVENPNGGKA